MSAPDFYSFVSFEPEDTFETRRIRALNLQRDGGSTWGRATIVNDEYPKPPYPHGFYLEGWLQRPEQMTDFDFPLAKEGVEAAALGGDA